MNAFSASNFSLYPPIPRRLIYILPSPRPSEIYLSQSNAFDFHRDTFWQLEDGNTRPSWLMSEELLINAVHLGEVVHGG